MKFSFQKEIYSKDALMKACYSFTNDFYIHISTDDQMYYIDLESKTDNTAINYKEFKNEIISQMVRNIVSNQTKDLRTLIMARAFSSSILYNDNKDGCAIAETDDNNIEEILTDWFDKNE